jgi:hypothetical protein
VEGSWGTGWDVGRQKGEREREGGRRSAMDGGRVAVATRERGRCWYEKEGTKEGERAEEEEAAVGRDDEYLASLPYRLVYTRIPKPETRN